MDSFVCHDAAEYVRLPRGQGGGLREMAPHVPDRLFRRVHQVGSDARGRVVTAPGPLVPRCEELRRVQPCLLLYPEPEGGGPGALDGCAAHLGITHGGVDVAGREEGSLGPDRDLDPASCGKVPDVHVAGVAPRGPDLGEAPGPGGDSQDPTERAERYLDSSLESGEPLVLQVPLVEEVPLEVLLKKPETRLNERPPEISDAHVYDLDDEGVARARPLPEHGTRKRGELRLGEP